MRLTAAVCAMGLLLLGSEATYAQTTTSIPAKAPAISGPVTVVTILDVVPNYAMANNVETSTALLDKLVSDTKAAPGLVSFQVLRDPNRPNHFIILGTWDSMQSFDQYSGAASTRSFRQEFQARQGGPFDERVYVPLK